MPTNKRILLSEIPTGQLGEEHFSQDEVETVALLIRPRRTG
jgi:hypothetical protein